MSTPILKQTELSSATLSQIESVNDDFFVLQLMLENKLELKIKQAITDAKNKMLDVFQNRFIPAYNIEKSGFDSLRKELLSENWTPTTRHATKSWYTFEFMQLPASIKHRLSKAGSVPEDVINVVSEINRDPFSDALQTSVFNAVQNGGASIFALFEIATPFNLRDANVETYLAQLELQLADAVTSQVSSAIRFEILEGVRNGESIPQISQRITNVWDKPIQVNVPAKVAPDGAVVRAGYSYNLDAETWATTVARTETARGYIEGKLNGYRQTGVVEIVQFMVTPDERLCPACGALEGTRYRLEDAGGIIPIHGSCRCVFIPIVELSDNIKALAAENVEEG